MNVLKNLLILTTFLGYKSFALAAKCNPSKLETRFSEVISKMPNLWGKYPSDTTFAIDDKTVLGNGYYVISSPEEAKKVIDSGLAEPCDGKPEIYKIKTASIVSENFFPGCSSLENEDACLPPLKDFYEKTKRNVGLHRADSKKHAKSFTSDGFKKHLNPIQIAVYDVSHEMFHSYQEDTGKFDSARKEPAADYLDCLKHAEWSKQYRTERKWWKQKVSEIYNPKTDQEKLRSLAVEFTDKIRPNTPKNKACNMSLDHIEIVEGTAHFVGNLGMLEIGVITHEELATIDSQYLESKSPYTHTYGTGGAISMLLQRLIGPNWKSIAEQGHYPSEILRKFLTNPEQCETSPNELVEKLQDLTEIVKKSSN